MFPATTNLYPIFDGVATNTVTIALYAVGSSSFKGGDSDPIGMPPVVETTSTFSFTITFAGNNTMVAGATNLPTGFLQHAKKVYTVVSLPANMTTNKITSGLLVTGGLLLNNLGILQPQ
jgi:hypothetical protein